MKDLGNLIKRQKNKKELMAEKAMVECAECIPEDEEHVYYCQECSDMIHKRFMAAHNVEPLKSVQMIGEKQVL